MGQAKLNCDCTVQLLAHYGFSVQVWSWKMEFFYYRWIDKPGRTCCLIVPDKLKEEVMHHCHLGQQKTIERVKQSFLWYRLGLDCTHYSFKVCNQNQRPNKHARDAMSRFHAGYLMERVHLDILGLFNTSESGNRYALMMVDQFTKWVEMSTIPG